MAYNCPIHLHRNLQLSECLTCCSRSDLSLESQRCSSLTPGRRDKGLRVQGLGVEGHSFAARLLKLRHPASAMCSYIILYCILVYYILPCYLILQHTILVCFIILSYIIGVYSSILLCWPMVEEPQTELHRLLSCCWLGGSSHFTTSTAAVFGSMVFQKSMLCSGFESHRSSPQDYS